MGCWLTKNNTEEKEKTFDWLADKWSHREQELEEIRTENLDLLLHLPA